MNTKALRAALLVLTAAAGCAQIIGFDDYEVGRSGAGGDAGAGGEGNAGGAGGTANVSCTPNLSEDCYTGPKETMGISECKAGTRTCNADGTGFGSCDGEVTPTLENCNSRQDENCDGLSGCTGEATWGVRMGDAGLEEGRSLAVDGMGNGIVAGTFLGTTSFGKAPVIGAGSSDAFVAKLSPSGEILWGRALGGMGNDFANAVGVDGAGNIYVAGSFEDKVDFGAGPLTAIQEGDIFLLKLDPTGKTLWSKQFGAAGNQFARGIDIDKDGIIHLVGGFTGILQFGGTSLKSVDGLDVFVAKLDAEGAPLWSNAYGGTGDQQAEDVAIDIDRNVVFTGVFKDTITFDSTTLMGVGPQHENAFVAKLTSGGAVQWAKGYGETDTESQVGRKVTIAAPNDIAVVGSFGGAIDFGGGSMASPGSNNVFVVRLDTSGNYLWARSFGDVSDQRGMGIAADALGNVLLAGAFSGVIDFGDPSQPLTSAGADDIFLMKLDLQGNVFWGKRFGSFGLDQGLDVVVLADGGAVLTGFVSGTVDFGNGILLNAINNDTFVAKFGP